MRLRDHYDWIVLGDSPGALLSACLTAKLGFSVLVLPLVPGGQRVVYKTRDCVDPESNYLLGLGRTPRVNGILSETFSRLGVGDAELAQLSTPDIWPQILTPNFRVTLYGDDRRFGNELARELGKDVADLLGLATAVDKFLGEAAKDWNRLPEHLSASSASRMGQDGPRSHRRESLSSRWKRVGSESAKSAGLQRFWFKKTERVSALVNRIPAQRGFEPSAIGEALRGIWFGVTSSEVDDPPLPELVQALSLARSGSSFRGGMTAYRQFLVRFAREAGAHVPARAECRKIFVRDGRFLGVQVASEGRSGDMVSAGAGALGCSVAHAREFISSGKIKEAPVARGWKFTISLVVRDEGIPPGAAVRMLWVESDGPPLEVEFADPAEHGIEEPGAKLVFLRSLLPLSQQSLDRAYQRAIAVRMFDVARSLFPFIERHLVRIFPDFRDPVEWERVSEIYGYPLPHLIPENLRVPSGNGLGIGTGIEGLFAISSESFPTLGSLGGTIAAVDAVAAFSRDAGLPGPFA